MLDTGRPRTHNGGMKTPHLPILLAGLVFGVAACAVKYQTQADPSTRYVVVFGSSTAAIKIKNRDDFKAALNRASWRRDIAFKPPHSNDPAPNATASTIASATVQKITFTQDTVVNPEGMHVTQRVGFNAGQEEELAALLKQVDQ